VTVADLERKIEEAADEIIVLKRQLEEHQTIALFWRQAAEHAVVGWNALEDNHEEAMRLAFAAVFRARHWIERVQDMCDARAEPCPDDEELEGWLNELLKLRGDAAPPAQLEPRARVEEQLVDLGDGIKLTVIEDETPVK
jgi:hypothetical protein